MLEKCRRGNTIVVASIYFPCFYHHLLYFPVWKVYAYSFSAAATE
jgi:hypothetical protein